MDLNLINIKPVDITYIGIGSAVVRDIKPENMQQFPPFLQSIYNTTDLKIRIINIDLNFEKPYLLPQFISDLTPITEKHYEKDRLEIIYIDRGYDLNELNNINKIIMDQKKLLIVGIYTGTPVETIETHFYNLYNTTKYKELFEKYITYDFSNDGYGGCMYNLLENTPIFNFNKMQIIKLNNISPNMFVETLLKYIENEIIITKLKNIIMSKLYKFIDNNHFVFRNVKINNLTEYVILNISKSIFYDIDPYHVSSTILDNKMYEHVKYYFDFIELAYNLNIEDKLLLTYLLNNLDDRDWTLNIKKIIRKFFNYDNL